MDPKQIAQMLKPKLVEELMKLGHNGRLLERMPLQTLRDMLTQGRPYENRSPKPEERPEGKQGDGEGDGQKGDRDGQSQSQAQTKHSQQDIEDILKRAEKLILPQAEQRDRDMAHSVRAQLEKRLKDIEDQHCKVVIKVETPGQPDVELPANKFQHYALHKVLRWHCLQGALGRVFHTYIHGPRGSGKTTLAKQVNDARAKILGMELPFFIFNFHRNTQPHDLMGYVNPVNGEFIETEFFKWVRDGGTILLDEFDSAGMLAGAINSALANGYVTFPHKMMVLNPTCRCIAAGNTIGKGATQDYVGRERQDAATLDRFIFIEIGYDLKMERQLAGNAGAQWCEHIQSIRKAIEKMGAGAPDLCPGTRAILAGADMLRITPDFPFEELEEYVVWQGADNETKERVRQELPKRPPKEKTPRYSSHDSL